MKQLPTLAIFVTALMVLVLGEATALGATTDTWGLGWLWTDDPNLTWPMRLGMLAMELVTWFWFFVLGAVLASFLNVVAWRWPRGESITRPPSRCPRCETRLAWYDNVPILGWLWLRGRCRYCGVRIPARYVLVELTLGLLFLGLVLVETLSGGWNLPVRAPNAYAGAMWIIWHLRWDLLRLFAYHAALISLLGTVVLVRLDKQRIPLKLAALLLVPGIVAPLVWPDLHPVPFAGPGLHEGRFRTFEAEAVLARRPEWLGQSLPVWGAADTVAGLASGALLGALLAVVARRVSRGKFDVDGVMLGTAATGTYLGWQAALSVALVTSLLWLVGTLASRCCAVCRAWPAIGWLFFAVVVQLACWRLLASVAWWPGPRSSWMVGLLAVVVSCAITAVAARLAASQDVGSGPAAARRH